jgi:hypothetical protein
LTDIVRIGAVLPTQIWLGHVAHSDQPLNANAGGEQRWRSDLDALAAAGISTLRIGFDWSRLQLRPQARLDGRWVEWYRQVLEHARELDVSIWACLLERSLPGWFADEGGFRDDHSSRKPWNHWVDSSAEAFHDLVDSWVALDDPAGTVERAVGDDPVGIVRSTTAVATAMRDAARLLRPDARIIASLRIPSPSDLEPGDGDPEVRHRLVHRRLTVWERALSTGRLEFPGREPSAIDELENSFDVVGLWLDLRECSSAQQARGRVTPTLERYAEMFPRRPLGLTLRSGVRDADRSAQLLDGAVASCRAARHDGIDLDQIFIAPGIATEGAPDGFLDASRQPTDMAAAVVEGFAQERPR